jgi:hypothetical protein
LKPWGEYQNGDYWGTAAGWHLVAMRKTDPAAAADMARDYCELLAQKPPAGRNIKRLGMVQPRYRQEIEFSLSGHSSIALRLFANPRIAEEKLA